MTLKAIMPNTNESMTMQQICFLSPLIRCDMNARLVQLISLVSSGPMFSLKAASLQQEAADGANHVQLLM